MPSRGPHTDLDELGASLVKVGASHLGPHVVWGGAPCCGLWEGPGLFLEGQRAEKPHTQGTRNALPGTVQV